MADTTVKIQGTLSTTSPSDVYPLMNDRDIKGGFRVVANETERLGIFAERRSVGMEVKQADTNVIWELYGGVENVNWRVKPGGDNVEARSNAPVANTIPLRDTDGKFPLKIDNGNILVGSPTNIGQQVKFPNNLSGQGGKALLVLPDGSGFTLGTVGSGGDVTWENIQQKPQWVGYMPTDPLVGNENKLIAVKPDGSGYGYIDAPSGGQPDMIMTAPFIQRGSITRIF